MGEETKGAFGNKSNKGKSANQKGLELNDKYFTKMSSLLDSYFWPDKGHLYEIINGDFVAKNKTAYLDLMKATSPAFHSKIVYDGAEEITKRLELNMLLDGIVFLDRNSGKPAIATKEGEMNMTFAAFLEGYKSQSLSLKLRKEKADIPNSIEMMLEFEYKLTMQNDRQSGYEYSDDRFFAAFLIAN